MAENVIKKTPNMNENTPKEKPKKKSHAKMISNIIFLVAMTILMLTLIFSLGELEQIGNTIKQIGKQNNYIWLLVAGGLALVYFLLWPLSLHLFSKASKSEATFNDDFLIGSSEHFYNGITPFAAGGQPFQVYSYSKRGVSSDKATGMILANFVAFMMATNVLAFISLFFWKDFTQHLDTLGSNMNWFKYIAITGFIINFLVLLFMISLGTSKIVRNGIYGLFNLICKPKWIGKHLNKFKPMLDEYINNAQTAFKEILKHKATFIAAFFIRMITMVIFYTIPFFIMKAVGLQIGWNQIHLVIFGTAFAITSVVFVPTPGGTGGIEMAFAIVIAALLGQSGLAETQAVSLIWRLLTYYLLMGISFICSAVLQHKINKTIDEKENMLLASENASQDGYENLEITPSLDELDEAKETVEVKNNEKERNIENGK